MKKTKIIAGAIIIALGSFAAGSFATYHYMDIFIEEIMRPFVNVDRYAMSVMDDYATASMLYKGNNAKALEIINLRLDSNVIALESVLSESKNERSIANAAKTINRVKALRDKYSYANDDRNIQGILVEIYDKYGEE